ncbi:hypothetical protein [Enhygromyxa salina]|uniref:Uncharacterized protein n=1 Tax=Enhygromyxa salina TaxID=215803 RepID=A0A2S9Y0A9_9BACT|nr:hypothetical protein [Enhygromyxa salina]PRP98544.1 hypothetical protein ENSA7_64870 [Enhygromyxa salina]
MDDEALDNLDKHARELSHRLIEAASAADWSPDSAERFAVAITELRAMSTIHADALLWILLSAHNTGASA